MTMYVTKIRGLNPVDGLVGGAIAGAVQTLVAIIYGLINRRSLWQFPQLSATLVGRPGNSALDGVIGVVVNVALLALFGLLFAVMARTLEQKALVWAALAYGLIVWAIGYFLVLPAGGVGWSPRLHDEAGALTLASSMMVYGSVLGAYLSRRQKRELVSRR
jgi:hypothetical protein